MAQLMALSTLSAVPFYEAMGFRAEAESTVALRGGLDFPVMQMRALL